MDHLGDRGGAPVWRHLRPHRIAPRPHRGPRHRERLQPRLFAQPRSLAQIAKIGRSLGPLGRVSRAPHQAVAVANGAHTPVNASSEHRDLVNCRHAERCSGCPLIALPYEEQLAHKWARVRAAFANYRAHGELQVDAVAPAEMHTGYRVRAKLMVSTDPT